MDINICIMRFTVIKILLEIYCLYYQVLVLKTINYCKFKMKYCIGTYIYITKIQRKNMLRMCSLWIMIRKQS